MPQTRRPDGLLHFITARLKIYPLTGKSEEGGIWSFLLNMTGKSKKVMWEFGPVKCQISHPSVTVRCPTWSMFHLHCTVEVKEELLIWEGQFEADERRQTEKNGRQKLSGERWQGVGGVGGGAANRDI